MDTGRRYVESCQFGHTMPDGLAEEFKQADESVLRPIRSLLGLGETVAASSAAAPLPRGGGQVLRRPGREDPRRVRHDGDDRCVHRQHATRSSSWARSAGRCPARRSQIAPDGEILSRGPLNTPGYLNLPEATAELIDADGWLHTGDIGSLDADGFLSVVDRKKELIITAGGRTSPRPPSRTCSSSTRSSARPPAYGDRRPYVVALLTLDGDAAAAWAGLTASRRPRWRAWPGTRTCWPRSSAAVASANARLARVQQVKRWRLLPAEWTPESGEVTPTLKLKRRVIYTRYADTISGNSTTADPRPATAHPR